jgi:hypothetical protein
MGKSEEMIFWDDWDGTFGWMIWMTFGWMNRMIGPGETKETEVSRAKDGFAGWRLWRWMNPFGIWIVGIRGWIYG